MPPSATRVLASRRVTPRERVRRSLRGERVDRRVFLPLIGSLVAKVIGRGVRETLGDPALLFAAVRDAKRLLGSDAHLVFPDETLLAEALGARVRWPAPEASPQLVDRPWSHDLPARVPVDLISAGRVGIAVEVFRRLRAAEPSVALGLAMSGPVELCRQLAGPKFVDAVQAGSSQAADALELVGEACLALLRACGETGLDLVVLLDDALPMFAAADDTAARHVWAPLQNLAGFYDAPIVLVSRAKAALALEALRWLAPAALVTDAWAERGVWDASPRVGVGLSVDDLGRQAALDALASLPAEDPRWFVSTPGPLGAELPVAQALALSRWVAGLHV